MKVYCAGICPWCGQEAGFEFSVPEDVACPKCGRMWRTRPLMEKCAGCGTTIVHGGAMKAGDKGYCLVCVKGMVPRHMTERE